MGYISKLVHQSKMKKTRRVADNRRKHKQGFWIGLVALTFLFKPNIRNQLSHVPFQFFHFSEYKIPLNIINLAHKAGVFYSNESDFVKNISESLLPTHSHINCQYYGLSFSYFSGTFLYGFYLCSFSISSHSLLNFHRLKFQLYKLFCYSSLADDLIHCSVNTAK